MKWCRNILFVFVLCVLTIDVWGGKAWKFGDSFIENINSTVYKGDIQIWAIERGEDGYMFFATATGLSVWDGVRWDLYKIPSEAYLRCLCYDSGKGLLYSAGDNEFGVWKQNEYGDFEYRRLYHNKDITAGNIFWRCYVIGEYVYFQTHEMILCLDTSDESVSRITSEGYIDYMHLCGQVLMVQVNKEFYRLEDQKLVALGYGLPDRVVNVINYEGVSYFIAENRGILVLEHQKMRELNPETNALFNSIKIFSASGNKEGEFLIGSVLDGFYQIDKNGKILDHVSGENGLQSTTVLSVGTDQYQNVWLGLDGGMAKVFHDPREKHYQCFSGKIGSVYAVVYYNNDLYLGTNRGLFKLNDKQEIQFIPGSQGQVWDIYHIGEDLIISHDKGLFCLDHGKFTRLPYPGSWKLRPLSSELNLYFSVNFLGLTIYELKNGHLMLRNHLENYRGTNNNAYVDKYGYIWLQGSDGTAVRLKTDKGWRSVEYEKSYYFLHEGQSMPGFCKLDNEIIFYSGNRAYQYNITEDSLMNSPYYSGLLKLCEDVPVSITQRENYFFYVTRNRIGLIERIDGKFVNRGNILNKTDSRMIPFAFRRIVPVYQDIYAIGLQNGVAFYDLEQRTEAAPTEILRLKRVEFLEMNQNVRLKIKNKEPLVFPAKAANVNLYFTGLTSSHMVEYRWDGGDWNPLVVEDAFSLPYLDPGTHVLEVRNMGVDKGTDKLFRQEIKMEKPWFLNEKSILMLFLAVIGLLLLGYQFYIRHLEKNHERLSVRQEEELRKQKAEHEFEMLRLEVKEKDKKLMNFTMDGINRNNMLGEIRDEVLGLKNDCSNPDSKIKSIVKKIDSHLNDKENWKVFEKYFNNIYDGFFDRLVLRYPDLTTNELKICAYIKLNLTSKEIAVLMNISPTSVEMARHRLRKKLDLPSETNLVNLMSEI